MIDLSIYLDISNDVCMRTIYLVRLTEPKRVYRAMFQNLQYSEITCSENQRTTVQKKRWKKRFFLISSRSKRINV